MLVRSQTHWQWLYSRLPAEIIVATNLLVPVLAVAEENLRLPIVPAVGKLATYFLTRPIDDGGVCMSPCVVK